MVQPSDDRYQFIDAIRGISIIGVLLIHASAFGNNENHPAWLSMLIKNGKYGVQCFFLVSAYTLFLSMRRRRGTERNPIHNFFIRRIFRIAPLYYLAIPIYAWSLGPGPRFWLGNTAGITTTNLFANFLFLHGLSPYWINSLVPGGWSITVEMFFYALCPLLFRKLTSLSRALVFLWISILIGEYSAAQLTTSPIPEQKLWGSFVYFFFPFQLQVFALGIVLFFALESTASERRISAFATLVALCFLHWHHGLGWVGYFLPACVLIALMARHTIYPLDNPLIRAFGRHSYGMYIAHWGTLQWLQSLKLLDFITPTSPTLATMNFLLRISLLLLCSYLIAYTLGRYVEKPFIRLGNKIIRHRENLGGSAPY